MQKNEKNCCETKIATVFLWLHGLKYFVQNLIEREVLSSKIGRFIPTQKNSCQYSRILCHSAKKALFWFILWSERRTERTKESKRGLSKL